MGIDRTKTQKYLRAFDFKTLFREELGWDNFTAPLPVMVEGVTYRLQGIAEKRGVTAFVLEVKGEIPPYALRRKIERQLAMRHREHLIVYSDSKTVQVWQWVRQEAGQPLASREHRYQVTQAGLSLIQKLDSLAVSLEEEEELTLPGVLGKVKRAFDVEKVTKKFYDQFKREHSAFSKFLKGVPTGDLADWYVSVMLNRLMFIYFIQKKGFLTGDLDYLRNKLAGSKARGADRFYRDFLCPLFFEGFATPAAARQPEVKSLLGDVPYLNGGIFARHQIEQAHGWAIEIPDVAFSQLFAFFDQYQWHLDDRPLHNDNEINPDVLGFIFEKYINQKQMGAYYTKEDITEYIGKNTIVPYLLEAAARSEPSFFKTGGPVWSLLSADPDRYIYAAMAEGTGLELPPAVAAGIADVQERGEWNKPAEEKYALPTEIWRETVARRQRHAEVRSKLAAGEIHSVADLITYNLDIRQFAQDVIESCEDAQLLRAMWKAIRSVSVLDPTCGSGAFHFAALNILEPLYEACLERMVAFVADEGQQGVTSHAKYQDFRNALAEVQRHPNQRYFVTKSIIVDNLYGVDIMHEAVEIAKLRLFLKLVSLVDDASKIEPLPDIDFNIRAGNTLVGFATYAEMEAAVRGVGTEQERMILDPEDEALLAEIREQSEDADRLFNHFRQMQTTHNMSQWHSDLVAAKLELQGRLNVLRDRLNQLISNQYGVNPSRPQEYEPWVQSHQPFHWFVEFYGIVNEGGFNVIIGNPPYVEYSKVRNQYSVRFLRCLDGNNLYIFTMERSTILLERAGWIGLIVPISFVSITDSISIRNLLFNTYSRTWMSHYAIRPAKLFEGVEQRLTIYLAARSLTAKGYWQTKYLQWFKAERPTLFQRLRYANLDEVIKADFVPKVSDELSLSIVRKVNQTHKERVARYLVNREATILYFHRTPGYWIRIMDFEPYFKSPTSNRSIHHIRELHVGDEEVAKFIGAFVSSSLYFFYFFATGNCRNLTSSDIQALPIGSPPIAVLKKTSLLFDKLMQEYKRNSTIKTRGVTEFQEFNWAKSKAIVDDIDRVLALHFGLTEEELDSIINYDIKVRVDDQPTGDEEE